AGLSNDELDQLVATLRSGDATGLSDVLRKTREELQALVEQKALLDLKFRRDQAGRTDDEQDVAAQLRDIYGEGYASQMNGIVAGQIRLTQETEKYNDSLKDVNESVK